MSFLLLPLDLCFFFMSPEPWINSSHCSCSFPSAGGGLQRSTTPETSRPTSSTFGMRLESSQSSSLVLRTISGLTRAECSRIWRETEAASTRGLASAKSSRMVKINLLYSVSIIKIEFYNQLVNHESSLTSINILINGDKSKLDWCDSSS